MLAGISLLRIWENIVVPVVGVARSRDAASFALSTSSWSPGAEESGWNGTVLTHTCGEDLLSSISSHDSLIGLRLSAAMSMLTYIQYSAVHVKDVTCLSYDVWRNTKYLGYASSDYTKYLMTMDYLHGAHTHVNREITCTRTCSRSDAAIEASCT